MRTRPTLAAILLLSVLLAGCTGQAEGRVRLLAIESFSGFGDDVEGGVCSAKVRNTNVYNVTVTYRFAGGETQNRTLRPVTEIDNDWTLLNGHCDREELDLVSVVPAG